MSRRWQSLYNKIILTFILVILIPIIFLIGYNITIIRDNEVAVASAQTLHRLYEQRAVLHNQLDNIEDDIRFLSTLSDVWQFVESDFEDADLETEIEQIFTEFAQNMGIYDQIRILSPAGMEIIRINYTLDNQAVVVPANQLQDKSDRPYFQESLQLAAGQIYLSPIELNQENNIIEVPHKPVMRYSIPIYQSDGDLGAILILNVLMDRLFTVTSMGGNGHILYFVNNAGDFIYTDGENKEVLYASDLGHDMSLNTLFPQINSERAINEEGTITNRKEDLFLSYITITATASNQELHWLLIDEQPLSTVLQAVNANTQSLRNIGSIALVITILIAAVITNTLVKPLRLLRNAVHKLKSHEWQASLKLAQMVQSRDEVGELAQAFEDMLHELQTVYHTLEERVLERTTELEAANEQLMKLDSIKIKFMEDMGHEIRTPLSSVMLNIELINRNPTEYQRYVDRVMKHVQHIRFLIDNISAITRMDTTKIKPDFEPLKLHDLSTSIVEMHRTLAEENDLKLTITLDENLPLVVGHYNQLSQVIDNLVTNAIKYTEVGTIQLYIAHDENTNQVCLTVKDSGIGISEADLARIFERYYRATNVRQSNIPGTGLGMAIVKEIIEWHNGSITIESELNQGTTVTVCLPTID